MKMTKFKKVLAVLLASMMLLSVASCTKNDAVPAESSGVAIPSDANTAPTIDLSGYSYETNYGSQLLGYLDRQYYFEGEAIPVDESNFYIIDAFIELTNYAT